MIGFGPRARGAAGRAQALEASGPAGRPVASRASRAPRSIRSAATPYVTRRARSRSSSDRRRPARSAPRVGGRAAARSSARRRSRASARRSGSRSPIRGRASSPVSIVIERPDDPDASPPGDRRRPGRDDPRVRFQAYGTILEPSTTASAVVRIRDLTAVVEDAGGFDEAGEVTQVEVGPGREALQRLLTRKRLDTPRGVWRAVGERARPRGQRGARRAAAAARSSTPSSMIRTPAPGQATRSRALQRRVHRALPAGVAIAGLDAGDLDLGDGRSERGSWPARSRPSSCP